MGTSYESGCVTKICATFTAFLFYGWYQYSLHNPEPPSILWIALIGFIIASAGGLYDFYRRKKLNVSHDVSAEDILVNLRQGQRKEFWLFLRPFVKTRHMPVPNYAASTPFSFQRFTPDETFDMRRLLAQATMPIPLIGFGHPGDEPVGGAILESDDRWWEDFQLLCSAARNILLIPSDRVATLRELDWLCSSSRLNDCLFFIPGKLMDPTGVWSNGWANVDHAYLERGIELPPLADQAQFFRLGPDRKPLAIRKESIVNYRTIRRAVRLAMRAPNLAALANTFHPPRSLQLL